MRRTLAIGFLIFLYAASAVLLITKAQSYANCHDIFSCSTSTGTNNGHTMCTIDVSWHGCDGTQPGGFESCINTGCVSQCSCSCQGSALPAFPAPHRVGSIVMMWFALSPEDAVVVRAGQRTNRAMRTTPVVPD